MEAVILFMIPDIECVPNKTKYKLACLYDNRSKCIKNNNKTYFIGGIQLRSHLEGEGGPSKCKLMRTGGVGRGAHVSKLTRL